MTKTIASSLVLNIRYVTRVRFPPIFLKDKYMHEPYEDDYDDYDDEDYHNQKNYNKHYFKFDPTAWDAWGKFLYDALNDIVESSPNIWYIGQNIPGFPNKSLPVNGYFLDTDSGQNPLLYLGNNQYNEPVYKKYHFVHNKTKQQYMLHLQSNAKHFVQQPNYYRSMFDILN